MENKKDDFIKAMERKIIYQFFIINIIFILIGYIGITLWLNAIRTTAPLWFVWVLIGIQFLLYSSIFSVSYNRALIMGFDKWFGFVFFVILAMLVC